jgi:uncharacterized protein YndB with AHSA1/START domain
MSTKIGELTITTPGTDIVMTREFNAPRDLVFKAHTSCEHMSRWWGPRKYEVADCKIDFREGGTWRIVHRGPDGDEMAFFGEYREILAPEKITWTFDFDGNPGDAGVETLTLEEVDGRTILTARSFFDNTDVRDAVLKSGMADGAAETFDRLAEYLEELAA